MDVCTIIAKNYLAHARVLARSFARHHPDGRFWTLIIDDFDGYVDAANEPFEVLTPAEIGCEPFIHMAMRYSVLELSTAVKPWLLRHLMGETGRPVTYLDPDIKIYGSLQPLDDLAAAHGVVLIPHNSEPIPPDDRIPSQVDIMIAGIYNLGYVSLAPRARSRGPARLVGRSARARLPRRPEVGVFRRPAMVRSDARVPVRRGDRSRPGVQPRLLEPPQPSARVGGRPIHGQWPPAGVLSLQRL